MSRKPDYRLKVLNKITEQKGEVGAGWANEDGSISIVLNPCITILGNDSLVLTLFPCNTERSKESEETAHPFCKSKKE